MELSMKFIFLLCCFLTFLARTEILLAKDKETQKSDLILPDHDFFSKHYREHFLTKDEFSGKDEMNDISFKEYVDNFDSLKLITARYRDDSNELRMVYGNDLAIKGLRNPDYKFEKGAVIYKLAYPAISDPAFISSKTPGHGYIRYQAMKYDPSKYATGWGYAIFGYDGKTFPGNPKETQDTCIACHDLVKDRNYVFSIMMENPNPKKVVTADKEAFKKIFAIDAKTKPEFIAGKTLKTTRKDKNINFELTDFKNIPDNVKVFIRQNSAMANKLSGNIMLKPFVAFMPEIVPLLISQTLGNKLPSYGVIDKKRTFFIFSYIAAPDKGCVVGKTNIFYGVGYYRLAGASNLLLNKKCYDTNKHGEVRSN